MVGLNFLKGLGTTAALTLVVVAAGTSNASAQTVASIKQSGVLKAGVQVAQVPWGFTDGSGKLTGFDVELTELLAKDLGVKPQFTPVTPSNRVAALLTGQIDMIAAAMGIFPDRQKVVLFSRPYTNIDNVYVGPASLKVSGYADLKGHTIGVPRGTPQDVSATKAAPSGATIQRFDDDASTVQALIAGQVDVVGLAATQLPNIDQVAGKGKFDQKFVISRNFDAIAVRPDAREWVTYINDFIARKIASRELPALYKKWIGGELAKMPTSGEGSDALPMEFNN
ncbi:ABC transporter substrate-binding protein [Aliidongia dinghuensis]|uniref:ABC transporter substrate-binding protein n=1 Tax=Aliidongia dinghuensis TaxID=1867774 RepID=A0A8J2Z0M9_9PROT|nr:transporter substrate-binding domain-containing protein [Aliidongia dinghuensis]GGF50781.1 ABC transporter substrate-binding protein [Aliidongia dinghuensis]